MRSNTQILSSFCHFIFGITLRERRESRGETDKECKERKVKDNKRKGTTNHEQVSKEINKVSIKKDE